MGDVGCGMGVQGLKDARCEMVAQGCAGHGVQDGDAGGRMWGAEVHRMQGAGWGR